MKTDTIESALADLEALKQRLLNLDKPKFEVGKVYRSTASNSLCLYKKDGMNFGFNHFGEWEDDIWMSNPKEWTPAPTEEWKQSLNAERIKLGIVKGVTVKRGNWSGIGASEETITGSSTRYISESDSLEFGGIYIYQQGQWAEVVEDKIMVGKWEVSFDGLCVFIGNLAYSPSLFKDLKNLYNCAGISVSFKGEELTIDTCQKIINKLSK